LVKISVELLFFSWYNHVSQTLTKLKSRIFYGLYEQLSDCACLQISQDYIKN